MRTLTQHLASYAAYHQDRRNVATHLVGIPLIVLAILVLLSRPSGFITFSGLPPLFLSPALVVCLVAAAFYARLSTSLGLIMALLLALGLSLAQWAAAQPTSDWLLLGVGGFVVGWVFQFIGHYFEGRKPAFVDDLMGLVIGPLFVLAELLWMLGAFKSLEAEVQAGAQALLRTSR